ncbi:MAG: riboflavin synthase [Deltaproteobacteria bacterium]|nr:MAG: riboflavin synthase [Deltaproteobacteria bacterium]
MFTGIIEGLGTISGIRLAGKGRRLSITSDFSLDHSEVGDSISVSGACLTAVVIGSTRFEVDLSPETVAKTTFGRIKIGDRVNLERAMRLSDRINGHLVTGHIDGVGTIRHKKMTDSAMIVTIGIPEALSRYMIQKGSVAVDGISLTINACDQESFGATIIPHTAKFTTIGFKKIGDQVNIETDLIGKYVERFIAAGLDGVRGERAEIDMQLLAKKGYL